MSERTRRSPVKRKLRLDCADYCRRADVGEKCAVISHEPSRAIGAEAVKLEGEAVLLKFHFRVPCVVLTCPRYVDRELTATQFFAWLVCAECMAMGYVRGNVTIGNIP